MDDAWLSLQQAADACGDSYRTMLAKVRRGEVPAEQGGKDWRGGYFGLVSSVTSQESSGDCSHK